MFFRHKGRHGEHHGRRFARGGFGRDPFGEGRGGGGRGGRGGLGRLFAHGDLRLVILQLIAERPRHGYELIKGIEERAGGAYSPSPGVIYPTLTLLEELGYITAEAEGGARKLYGATGPGLAFLAENEAAVRALLAKMEEAGRQHDGARHPAIERARENLRMAMRLRLSRGPVGEAQALAIAAALDAAAQAIERA